MRRGRHGHLPRSHMTATHLIGVQQTRSLLSRRLPPGHAHQHLAVYVQAFIRRYPGQRHS